jgi:hypothetical protein
LPKVCLDRFFKGHLAVVIGSGYMVEMVDWVSELGKVEINKPGEEK